MKNKNGYGTKRRKLLIQNWSLVLLTFRRRRFLMGHIDFRTQRWRSGTRIGLFLHLVSVARSGVKALWKDFQGSNQGGREELCP